ncbi:hypothetical protein PsorP6_008593 [Peronosclerospora sorghi]|uniref:Uncharacterized protein n=1 Tax=Peronosclerospora sorghi TaxID=230839 RepID=A0ACC0W9W6_9STRA|nr:hypothetical protein PsorP6_008593 [Peronosclerospora sorghi]
MPSHKMLDFLALHGLNEIEHHGLLLQNRRQQLRVLILLDFKLSPLHALELSHLFVRMSSLLGQFEFELELQELESALSVLCDLSFFPSCTTLADATSPTCATAASCCSVMDNDGNTFPRFLRKSS